MNLNNNFGQIARIGVLFAILFTAFSYAEESVVDAKIIDIAKKFEGEFSIQFDDIDINVALNDSIFLLKFAV